MACQIKRNKSGVVLDVLNQKGESSKLFHDIHGTLFLADTETSLKIFANAYSEKMQTLFEGKEPALTFKTNNKTYESLEELILNEKEGDISLGFTHPKTGDHITIATVNNTSERGAQLTSLVKQGYLSAERVLAEDGSTRLMGKGEFATSRQWGASQSVSEMRNNLGRGEYTEFPDGSFTMVVNDKFTQVEGLDGQMISVLKTDIPTLVEQGKIAKPIAPIVEHILEFDNPRAVDKDKAKVKKKTNTDVKGIQAGLTNFLKSVGFNTTTLEAYRKNYNTKYGKDPDIRALADIANQIVAVNPENIEDLSEEVAHVAIEMYSDQRSIASALAGVHNTPEYSEFYDQYKEKYSKFHEGLELEDHIRKEILGKILKKSILEKFSTKGKTAGQATVIGKLAELWSKVYNFISNRVTAHHYQALDILNERIANSIFNETSEDFTTDIKANENFFYSLMDNPSKSIENELKVAKRNIEDLYRTALGESVPNQAELDHLSEVQDEYNMISSINTIVGIASHQMDILKLNVEDVANSDEVLSMKDAARYEVLKGQLIPTLNNIKVALGKVTLSEKVNKKLIENIIKASDEVVVNLSAVEPLMNADNNRFVDRITEKILAKTELTEEKKNEIRTYLEGGFNDLTWAGKFFGLASHLSNPVMQMLASEVSAISTRVTRKFTSRLNEVVNEIDDKGLMKYQKSIIKKGTHFFLAPIDEAAYQADLKAQENKFLAEAVGKSEDAVIKLREKFNEREILKTDEALKEYRDKIKTWKETEGIERRNSQAYYTEREARFDKAQTSEETRKYMSSKNAARYDRLKKYTNEDGTIDASKQTAAERIQDDTERKAHLSAKSAYDSGGNIKPGLKIVNPKNLTEEEKANLTFEVGEDFVGEIITLAEKTTLEDLTLESRKALDLFNLDMLFREESANKTREGKPLQQFINRLKGVEKGGSSLDWALDNASIQLSSEYYDNLGSPIGFNDIAQDYVDGLEDITTKREKQILLDRMINLQRSRKALLKQNKYANSAVETDVHHMTSLTRNGLLALDAEITETRKALGVPYDLQEQIDQPSGESAFNEDYSKMLKESGLTEYQFALQHMTERNSVSVRDFALQVEDIITGKRSRAKESYEDFIQETISDGKITENTPKQEAIQILNDEFAKRHVASYFKRFQPAGYSTALEKLKTGEVKVSDLVENKEAVLEAHPEFEFIEIRPDYSWSEDLSNDDFLNKNFKEGLSVRPRLDKYLDPEFFSKYGIKKADYHALDKDDLGSLTPTKNVEEFEFLKMMVGINEESIELLDETGRVSKYQRPQISKERVEKFLNIAGKPGQLKNNAKDAFTDIFQSKLDEKEYGEQVDGLAPSDISVKIIPKYYQSQLESADIVTDNTLQAVMANYKAALRYKERVGAERAVKALEHKISQQKFTNRGAQNLKSRIFKKGEISSYYEKAQEMSDYHLYGIKQTRQFKTEILGKEVDLTQAFNKLTGYVARVNLSFNPIVDLTSWTTGVYNNILDTAAEEFYSKAAAKKATTTLPKMVVQYLAESGKINKKSDLNHLMEFYQVNGAEERLSDSAQVRGVRMLGKSGFGLSEVANLPVTPKNMLSILYDHKFVGGRFKSFNDFVRSKKQSGTKDMKSIKAEWANMEESLFDNLTIDPKKGVMMNEKFKAKFENPTQEFNELHEQLTRKITQVNQSVDSIISEADKTQAQRDVLLSSMMLHRSWIIINLTRKFKGEHFNIATGQIEKGQYRGFVKIATKLVKAVGKKGAIKEVLRNLEEHERRNMGRSTTEIAALTLLVLMARAVLAADDDDDTAIENMAQLLAVRTVSESQSASFLGIPGTIADTYADPLIHARYAENVYKAITKGDGKYIAKNTLYKRKYQFEDLQKQVDAYRHFNSGTLVGIGED